MQMLKTMLMKCSVLFEQFDFFSLQVNEMKSVHVVQNDTAELKEGDREKGNIISLHC